MVDLHWHRPHTPHLCTRHRYGQWVQRVGNDDHKVGHTTTSLSFPRLIVQVPVGGWAHFERERSHDLTTRDAQVKSSLLASRHSTDG